MSCWRTTFELLGKVLGETHRLRESGSTKRNRHYGAAGSHPGGRRFAYRVDRAPSGNNVEEQARFSQILEEAGQQGWELVGFYGDQAYFKRPIAGKFIGEQER
jgi:hypothetical protein